MVDQDRQPEQVRLLDRERQGVAVVCPEGALHPVEDVVPAGTGASLNVRVNPEIVDHRARVATEGVDAAERGASPPVAARAMLRSIPSNTSRWMPHSAYQ